MAPSGRKITRPKAKTKAPRKPRKTYYKKQLQKSKKISIQESSTLVEGLLSNSTNSTISSTTCSNTECLDFERVEISASSCSTPKADRFRIPEIVTCPPAPKKQRVMPNCSLQRTPIAFFAPPDLELFFFFALRDISV